MTVTKSHSRDCAWYRSRRKCSCGAAKPRLQHKWFIPATLNYQCCQSCGLARAFVNNTSCRGPVRVQLRQAENGEILPITTV